jgi:hypothetical protein
MDYRSIHWGPISLAVECVSFGVYVLCFLIWRFDLSHSPSPLSGFLPKLCVRLVLVAILLAIVGLIRDAKKSKAFIALALIFPALTIMGILNGKW